MATQTTRNITVDEQGRSCIATVNGEYLDDGVGTWGESLEDGDEVELEDGTTWTVDRVYTRIQTGGCGGSNYVYVSLVNVDK